MTARSSLHELRVLLPLDPARADAATSRHSSVCFWHCVIELQSSLARRCGAVPILHTPLPAQTLTAVRAEVAKLLGLDEADLELSMGMSGDFEQAVRSDAPLVC